MVHRGSLNNPSKIKGLQGFTFNDQRTPWGGVVVSPQGTHTQSLYFLRYMFVCAAGIRQPPTTCYPLSLFLEKGRHQKSRTTCNEISQEMAASCHFRANSNSCSLSETELRQSKNLNEYAENIQQQTGNIFQTCAKCKACAVRSFSLRETLSSNFHKMPYRVAH